MLIIRFVLFPFQVLILNSLSEHIDTSFIYCTLKKGIDNVLEVLLYVQYHLLVIIFIFMSPYILYK